MKRKVALITGATRGIGKATALAFASAGYDVVIDYYKSKKIADELQAYIESNFKVKAITVCANVGDEGDVTTMVEQIYRELGAIDVLVNNAAIAIDKPFLERSVDDIKKTFTTNFLGPVMLTRLIAPNMAKNKYGKIINVSSNNADKYFDPVSYDYDASKAALNNFTKNCAAEFAPYVNVNAVAPGWVNTDMNKDFPKEFFEMECKRIKKGRIATPEDIAKVILFLASDDADYINGEIITVDGGM